MISSSQPSESPKISPSLFAQSSSTLRGGTQEPEKPEHGFEEFMDSIQGSNRIENVLISSSPNIRHKRDRSPSSPTLPQPLNVSPVKLVTKGLQNAGSIAGSDRPPKKLKESHAEPESETRFYYQCKSGQDLLLPVAVNDTVIRLRTKKEMEESGKQSKYDVFDGPWTVLGISETSFPLSFDFFVLEEEDSDSTVSRQAKWDKMLTTKVKLNFPEGSMADSWVEISRLLPAIDHKAVGDSYEVVKIRQKRLRLYTRAEAKQMEATQYDDKWVKTLLAQHGHIARNKIIVDEYLCSWAG
ncbi:hypothetical protein VC83_02512 [Pseudogymnoascus destructans]|uniref:Uncharacterized protein n=2 Tax=Pseudogymnoascus destructans TaxID=655981 RepID=L8FXT5_PSED2|nr:uncharacterized protein VC83_02512 [Pseudogymnoascus destructans]ELR05379.1 hypothetical protein GMDG_07362 [Pseudogymnoascus destructans 20631-21]OAF61155.1 hypothetical protein VC83_02512 [Pseudogymnoascus destructans]